MKNSVLFSALLIIGLFSQNTQTLYAQDKFISIEELDSKGLIKTKFTGTGIHSGHAANLTMKTYPRIRLSFGLNPDVGWIIPTSINRIYSSSRSRKSSYYPDKN